MRSSLETFDIHSREIKVIYQSDDHIEAPNSSKYGSSLIFNGGGRLYRIGLQHAAEPVIINTGFANRCKHRQNYHC